MKCPHCGKENPANTIFCQECNAWILGSVLDENTDCSLPDECDRDPQPPKHRKWLIPAISGVVALAVLLTALFWPRGSQSMETTLPDDTATTAPEKLPAKYYYRRLGDFIPAKGDAGRLSLVSDTTVFDTDFAAEDLTELQTNLDGTVAAMLANSDLYLFDIGEDYISADVLRFSLSLNGNAVSYMDTFGQLTLYNHRTRESVQIADNIYSFAISPDGRTVAFTTPDYRISAVSVPTCQLNLYQNGTLTMGITETPFNRGIDLLTVSNDGAIHLQSGDMLMHVTASGDVTSLGQSHDAYGHLVTNTHHPYLYASADHTDLLFFGPDGTYLSEDGATPLFLSKKYLLPVNPQFTCAMQSAQFLATCPFDSFRDQVYLVSNNSMLSSTLENTSYYYVNPDGATFTLCEKTYTGSLSPDGLSLYCMNLDGTLRHIDARTGTVTPIAANVRSFAIPADYKQLYYTASKNGQLSLFRCDPLDGGNATCLARLHSISLYPTADGNLIFQVDENLWDSHIGSFHLPVSTVMTGKNGTVYYQTEAGLYCHTLYGSIPLGAQYTLLPWQKENAYEMPTLWFPESR